jgi:hypothetical protein
MMPLQPFMNQLGGGYYPTRTGPWCIPEPFLAHDLSKPVFPRSMVSDATPRLPFLATLNFPDLSKLMNDLVHHDPSWPPHSYQASL